MSKITNDIFLRALRRQPVDRTPVWIMRQAGRYMPEYRALRAKAGEFLTLCKTPELACAATMLPIRNFDLDAAIVFSDILMIPEAMGMGLSFVEQEGPKFARVITNISDVARLPNIDPAQDLSYVSEAIQMIVHELAGKVPLIGFAGSPWTVSTYMIEGQTSKQFNKVRGFMYKSPQVMHKLLAHMSTQISNSLLAQIHAGVDVVMIFDTWGGILSESIYKEFSLAYMADVVKVIKITYPNIPVIIFSKNGGKSLIDQANIGCTAIGLDWTADITAARALVGDRVALQGNLDPCVLYADPEYIQAAVRETLRQYGPGTGHIFNLGHGISPDVDPRNVQVLLEAVKTYSPEFHR